MRRDQFSTLAKHLQPHLKRPGTVISLGGGGSDSATQGYVASHIQDPDTGVYFGHHWGIHGGLEDESARLQTMLNDVGLAGGGRVVIRARVPTDSILIHKLTSIYYSNVWLEFRSPVKLNAVGGLRIMGSMLEYVRAPATAGGKLDVNAVEGDTELVLATSPTSMQASDFIVGDYIVVRGLNRADGNAIQKQYLFVTAINTGTNTLTVHAELEYTFQPTYTTGDTPIDSSEYGPDATTGTVIKVIASGLAIADITRGMYEFEVTNLVNFAVGQIVRLADTRNENDINPSAIRSSLLPYENECNMEFARIIKITATTGGQGIVTLDHAVSKEYLVSAYASISVVEPVENSKISGFDISYDEVQTSKNYHAVTCAFGLNCHIHTGHVYGYGYRLGQGVRISDSYLCKGSDILVEGGVNYDSGEVYGYGGYKSTGTVWDNCIAKDCRHGLLVQADSMFTIQNCQSWAARISDFDLHGALEVDGLIKNCQAFGGNQHTPDASDIIAFQAGNTSHTVGSHHIVFENCTAVGYKETNGAGFAYCPNSSNIEFNGCQVYDSYWGITFRRNSYQCLPVQDCENIRIINCTFYDCTDRAVRVIGAPVTVGTSSVGMISGLTIKGCQTVRCSRHYVIDGNLGVENLIMEGNDVLDPIALSGEYAYDIKDINGVNSFRNNGAIGANKGMRLENVLAASVITNILTPTIESVSFVDAGGNTGLQYADPLALVGGGSYLITDTLKVDQAFTTDVTAKQFSTIAAAMAVAGAGATIILAPGTYTENVVMAYAGIKLVGSGAPGYDLATDTFGTGGTRIVGSIDLDNLDGCGVRGMAIDGRAIVGGGDGIGGGASYALSSVMQRADLRDLVIVGAGSGSIAHGIRAENGSGWTIENVWIFSCAHGVALRSSHNHLTNVHAVDCGFSGFIIKSDTPNGNVYGNHLTNCTTRDGGGFVVEGYGSGTFAHDNALVNCYAYGATTAGFSARVNAGSVLNLSLTNCRNFDSVGVGFDIVAGANIVLASCHSNGSTVGYKNTSATVASLIGCTSLTASIAHVQGTFDQIAFNGATTLAGATISGTAALAALTANSAAINGSLKVHQSGAARYYTELIVSGGVAYEVCYDSTGATYLAKQFHGDQFVFTQPGVGSMLTLTPTQATVAADLSVTGNYKTGEFTSNVTVSNTTPALGLVETDNIGVGIDNSKYSWVVSGGILRLRMYGDSTGQADILHFNGDSLALTELEIDAALTTINGALATGESTELALGTSANGALMIHGTTNASHFNYGGPSGAQDTYIRGGKSTSDVNIGDLGSGNVVLGKSGAGEVIVVHELAVGTTGPQGPLHAVEGAYGGMLFATRTTLTAASDILTTGTIPTVGGNPVVGISGVARHSIGGVIPLNGASESGASYAVTIGGGTLTFSTTTGGKHTATPAGAGNWDFSAVFTYI